MVTSDQIRAARALLRWSARELSERSRVSLPTIQRMEAGEGVPGGRSRNLDTVMRTLEEAGVAFIYEDDAGPGVRFRNPEGRRRGDY